MRQISITKTMNGYIVQVGCQTLVFESKEKLLVELARYLNDPQGVEKEYVEKFGMKDDAPRNFEQAQCDEVRRTADVAEGRGIREATATAAYGHPAGRNRL